MAKVESKRKISPWTHNVVHGLAATGLYCLGNGLYQLSVLPSFILQVGGSNFAVGFAEGLQGIATMVSALPAGYLADRVSRGACIKLGQVLQLLSGVCLIWAVIYAQPGNLTSLPFIMLCAALSLQGVCDGIINGPMVALMDDSCPSGFRSEVETWNTVVYESASSVGPLVALGVFVYLGNHWSLHAMQVVIIVGAVLAQLSAIPAFRMDDKKALGQESEAVHLQDADDGSPGEKDDDLSARIHGKPTCFGMLTGSSVIYVMFVGNLVVSLGAGMTVKFFPVFFQQEGHVDPASLQVVFASLSGLTVMGTILAERAARKWGRLQIVIPAFATGVCCTAVIGLLANWGWTRPSVMLPLFTVRCTAMWSVSALQGSIVADYTPKATRGRWKALNSVTSLGWSGSAAVGGWLIDQYGYGVCFTLTACFQGIALPLFCLLLPHVAKESDLREKSSMAEDGKATPLLRSPGTPLRTRSISGNFESPVGGRHSGLEVRAQAFASPPSGGPFFARRSDEEDSLPR